jgi:hypothetical protein
MAKTSKPGLPTSNNTINVLQLLVRVTDAATEFAYDDTSGFRFDIRYQGTAGNNAEIADANNYVSGSAGVARPFNNSLIDRNPYTFHSTVRDPQYVVPGPSLSGQNGFGASGFGDFGGDDGFGDLGNNSLRALALARRAEQDQNSLQGSSPTPQPSSSGARGVSHCLTSFCTFKI